MKTNGAYAEINQRKPRIEANSTALY